MANSNRAKYFVIFWFFFSAFISITLVKKYYLPKNFNFITYFELSRKEKEKFGWQVNNYHLSSLINRIEESKLKELNHYFGIQATSKDSILSLIEAYFEGEKEWNNMLVKNKIIVKEDIEELTEKDAFFEKEKLELKEDKVLDESEFKKWWSNFYINSLKPLLSFYIQDDIEENNIILENDKFELLVWPLNSEFRNITSKFGYRDHPVFKHKKMHYGIDVAAPKKTIIISPANGRVKDIGFNKSMGYYIIINHGEAFVTSYSHLNKIMVDLNSVINQGQKIGLVGSSGLSTGPHLHFEISAYGKRVNPLMFTYKN